MFLKRARKAPNETPRRRQSIEDEQTPLPSQFRRNQTLSSYRHNTPEESTRQKAHQLTRQRRRLGGIFLLVAIAAVLLALLLWQLIAQVRVTTSTRQLSTSFVATDYEKAINQYLLINPSQRLRFSLDAKALTAYISDTLPEVESVRLTSTPGIAQSDFSITFRTPVAGWQINSKQYYVDASGVVFQKNYYQAPAVQIVDQSGATPEQGSTVVGTRLLGFLGKIVSQAQGRGYIVNKAVLPQGTTREVDVYFEGKAAYAKMVIDRGAGEQVEDFDRSVKYLQSRGVNPQYIDVRISGRAAYK